MDSSWEITVNVAGKTVPISCGEGVQRIKWLAHVAIARWDEDSHQGWKRLGVPTEISTENGVILDMGAIIKEVLTNGDRINVLTSLEPSETF